MDSLILTSPLAGVATLPYRRSGIEYCRRGWIVETSVRHVFHPSTPIWLFLWSCRDVPLRLPPHWNYIYITVTDKSSSEPFSSLNLVSFCRGQLSSVPLYIYIIIKGTQFWPVLAQCCFSKTRKKRPFLVPFLKITQTTIYWGCRYDSYIRRQREYHLFCLG